MLLDLKHLKNKYDLNIKGVIHVGGHYGEENELYQSLEIKNKIFFEPASRNFKILKEKVTDALLVNKALGNENKKITLNVETFNGGQSNSILEPKLHLQHYPQIQFLEKEEIEMIRLDDFLENKQDYNFLNMDVQGYELEVLFGSKKTLSNIDYIISEINRDEVYKDCAKIWEITTFLNQFGFSLVEETWYENGPWGDGFFIKG